MSTAIIRIHEFVQLLRDSDEFSMMQFVFGVVECSLDQLWSLNRIEIMVSTPN